MGCFHQLLAWDIVPSLQQDKSTAKILNSIVNSLGCTDISIKLYFFMFFIVSHSYHIFSYFLIKNTGVFGGVRIFFRVDYPTPKILKSWIQLSILTACLTMDGLILVGNLPQYRDQHRPKHRPKHQPHKRLCAEEDQSISQYRHHQVHHPHDHCYLPIGSSELTH
jgi:hypothetical protein